jgi:hypothetical protein
MSNRRLFVPRPNADFGSHKGHEATKGFARGLRRGLFGSAPEWAASRRLCAFVVFERTNLILPLCEKQSSWRGVHAGAGWIASSLRSSQ